MPNRNNIPTVPNVFASHPCMFFICFLLSFLLIAGIHLYLSISVTPNFAHPDAGFATTKTEIYNNWQKLQLLRMRTSSDSQTQTRFVDYPVQYRDLYLSNSEQITELIRLESPSQIQERSLSSNQNAWADSNLYFCGQPGMKYGKIVFKSATENDIFNEQSNIGKSNLFTLKGIQSMCKITFDNIIDHQDFKTICDPIGRAYCCPVWSLGNYIALLRGRESCNHITAEDVDYVHQLLNECRGFYINHTLLSDCWKLKASNPRCENIPERCTKYNAVYEILNFIVDENFAMSVITGQPLTTVVSFIPVQKGSQLLKIYLDNFSQYSALDCNWWSCVHPLNNFGANISIVACDFGIENVMFTTYLYNDVMFPLMGLLVALILTFIYVKSLFLIFVSLSVAAFSLLVTTATYTALFDSSLPFVSIAAVFVLFCVALNNLLLFYTAWADVSEPRSESTFIYSNTATDPEIVNCNGVVASESNMSCNNEANLLAHLKVSMTQIMSKFLLRVEPTVLGNIDSIKLPLIGCSPV